MDAAQEYEIHKELFLMLRGLKRWDGEKVAAGLRSPNLSHAGKSYALLCLANLIDGKGSQHLKITGRNKRQHIVDLREEYERTMQIGRWVQSQIDSGETFRSALAAAEDQFGVSESTAQRAISIFRERRENAEKTGGWYPLPPVRKR